MIITNVVTTQNWRQKKIKINKKQKKKKMFVSIQVMMWKKCFFSDSALLGKRGYGTMSTSFGHMFLEKSCFGRMFCYYELWFHFVRISWNICNYNLCWFELWTCCMVQREPIIWCGRGAGGHGWCSLSLLLSSLSNILLLPLAQRHFQSMIVLGIGVLPLSQWSAMSWAETPNCKIFIKILELLCILTKPKLKKKKKLAHTCCLVKMRDTYTLTFCSVCFIEILWYIL
jgi:hypothetical protein